MNQLKLITSGIFFFFLLNFNFNQLTEFLIPFFLCSPSTYCDDRRGGCYWGKKTDLKDDQDKFFLEVDPNRNLNT
jgi:hypothetical protein